MLLLLLLRRSVLVVFALGFAEEMHDVQVIELYGDVVEEELDPKKWGPRVVPPRSKNTKRTPPEKTMSNQAARKIGKEFEAAVQAGDVEAIRSWLDAGFDVEASALPEVRRLGYTPLINAVVYRHPSVLELLLERGADPDVRSIWMTSPLSIAAHCKPDDPVAIDRCLECVDLLLAYGADINGRTDDGWTPLFHAARARNMKILHHLLANGADPNLVETWNNEKKTHDAAYLRDYLDHALLRSSPDWAECLRGKPQVKGNCNKVQAWARAGIEKRDQKRRQQQAHRPDKGDDADARNSSESPAAAATVPDEL
ncbi:hypothetical protein CTAYLR_002040 [Chrysophaeum taylorii]|uniref:Uncharacterized protein n=1 Tax=Chrysophaeum taylorii TaxID=2483200 RepID=A0AAD7UPR2_9STRA|nr:hypothetical protein CTAYLR_002040 [Chrysophaeum taylorii]